MLVAGGLLPWTARPGACWLRQPSPCRSTGGSARRPTTVQAACQHRKRCSCALKRAGVCSCHGRINRASGDYSPVTAQYSPVCQDGTVHARSMPLSRGAARGLYKWIVSMRMGHSWKLASAISRLPEPLRGFSLVKAQPLAFAAKRGDIRRKGGGKG